MATLTLTFKRLLIGGGVVFIVVVVLVAVGVHNDDEARGIWASNQENWDWLKSSDLNTESEAQIVERMKRPSDDLVTNAGGDYVLILGPLSSGEKDLWWSTGTSSAVGFRITNDGRGPLPIERSTYTVRK